jgi:hypothetical protein
MSVARASISLVTEHVFSAELWQWQAREEPGGWFFVSLPFEVSDQLDETAPSKGFGSIRVEVTIGRTTWRTSVFPSKEEKTFVLPVKKAVRDKEGLVEGGSCQVTLRAL